MRYIRKITISSDWLSVKLKYWGIFEDNECINYYGSYKAARSAFLSNALVPHCAAFNYIQGWSDECV
jgi:hypothetical protein